MQLPGGSTRIPPARAPVSLLVIINGSNIASTVVKKRNNGRNCSGSGGAGGENLRKSDSSGNGPENEPRLVKRNRHPETRTNSRHRVTEKLQLLASAPRRKERGEE
ncbi:uncharacterized protein LOC123988510 [Osmia bicornis bicornis]|uniref:uncharacterized protein LOC123988510 n=1 Tax=Osmia bicornis bicornis TaxID=1437191 RepID=UPI001EAF4DD5|nr:uncharacterized protein LOC123988510 [Osmia bicornis bicornis]